MLKRVDFKNMLVSENRTVKFRIRFDLKIHIDYDYKKVLLRSLDRRLRSVISGSSDFTTALTTTTLYFCNWTRFALE